MLRVEAVQKCFDSFVAVAEADLVVERGEVIAVIGPNGAGKSTLFKLITGHLKPDRGRIIFKDEDIAGFPAYGVCRKGISLSYQIVNIFNRLTVFENVQAAVLSHQGRTFNLLTPARSLAVKETKEILEAVSLSTAADRVS